MSRHNGPKLELKLNLPTRPQRTTRAVEPPKSPSSSDEEEMLSSPSSSCVSSEFGQGEAAEVSGNRSSPEEEEATPMVVVGCPRCLMYVMVAETRPRCPQCKSSVLLNLQEKIPNKKN